MLDFSPTLTESKLLTPWLFFKAPEMKINWSIVDIETKMTIDKTTYQDSMQNTTRYRDWRWPEKKIHFISDIHADADALVSSLILSKTIKKTGIKAEDFILTSKGKKDRVIIGGDCLDKGPSNLTLLRTLKKLMQLKKNTILLAGNHDIRLYMGLKSLNQTDNPCSEHFFVRMGIKVIPLLKEVYNDYLLGTKEAVKTLSDEQCRRLLFPSKQWQGQFIKANKKHLNPEAMEIELKKLHEKWDNFESDCLDHGLNLEMAYQASQKCHALFLQPDGEFFWFFNKMKLIHREKSFLFTHAGLDNKITKVLQKSGIKKVNNLFKRLLTKDLCQFYYGSVANMIRTKYRKTDPILSLKGVKRLHRLGIHAIVHGHVSQLKGQNISLRSGMLHFECDVTLDKNSRKKAGLPGFGAGVTTISPKGNIKAISTDAPFIKIFQPKAGQKQFYA